MLRASVYIVISWVTGAAKLDKILFKTILPSLNTVFSKEEEFSETA